MSEQPTSIRQWRCVRAVTSIPEMNRQIAVPFAPDRDFKPHGTAQKPPACTDVGVCSATTSTKGRNRQTSALFVVQNPSV